MSRDPLGFAGQQNLHTYIGNVPLSTVDPSGLFSFPPWDVFMFLVDVGFVTWDWLTDAPLCVKTVDHTALLLDLLLFEVPGAPGGLGRTLALAGKGEAALARAGARGGLVLERAEARGSRYVFERATAHYGARAVMEARRPVQGDAPPFSIIDWSTYPTRGGVPEQRSPKRLIFGAEYKARESLIRNQNRGIRRQAPELLRGLHIHEDTPIHFDADPVNAPRSALPPDIHAEYTAWWERLADWLIKMGYGQ